jgi:hypothetical protein
VQVLPFKVGELGREQSAVPFNVLPMAPHSGRFEVNHPPSPLWMFLSRIVDWIKELAAAPDSLDHREVKADLELRLASLFYQTTHLGNFMASSSQTHGKPAGVEASLSCRFVSFLSTATLLRLTLIEAFEEALRALKLADRKDPLTMTVAKLIVEFAKEGERDPSRLRDLVVKTLQPE